MSPKKKEQFDPHAPAHGVSETPSMDIGAVQPSGTSVGQVSQLLTAQAEAATNSRRIVDGFIKNADFLVKDLRNTQRELKRVQLHCALQEIYTKNGGDYGKCEPEWNAVIDKAKQDEDFIALEGGTGAIEVYAAEKLTRYREDAIANARQLATESRLGILTQEITAKQTDLRINFAAAINAKTTEENDRAVQENIKLYGDIGKILQSKQADGMPVFKEIDKANVMEQTNALLAECYVKGKVRKFTNIVDVVKLSGEIESDRHEMQFGELLGWRPGTPSYKDDGTRNTELEEKFLGQKANFLKFGRNVKESVLRDLENRKQAIQKENDMGARRGLVEQVKRGEKYPDPGNATYKSAVSEYYMEFHNNTITPLFNNDKNPDRFKQIAQEEKDFIAKFKFLPGQMTDFLESQFEYGQPQASAMACDVANYVYSHKAGYVTYANPSYLRSGGLMLYGARLYDNGIPPETVQELVKKIKNVPKSVVEERAKTFANPKYGIEKYGRDKLFEAYNNFLKDFRSTVAYKWTAFPSLDADLERDFILAYETIYESCGDMESSAKAAIGVVRRKWGITKINGEISVAPYAIEDRLGNDIFDAELARKRAWEFACEHAKARGDKILPLLESVHVDADEQTEKEIMQGKIPTYAITYVNEYFEKIRCDDDDAKFRFSLYAGLSDGAKLKLGIAETDAALQQNRLISDKLNDLTRRMVRKEMFALEKLAKVGVPKSKAETDEEEKAKKKESKKADAEDKK